MISVDTSSEWNSITQLSLSKYVLNCSYSHSQLGKHSLLLSCSLTISSRGEHVYSGNYFNSTRSFA